LQPVKLYMKRSVEVIFVSYHLSELVLRDRRKVCMVHFAHVFVGDLDKLAGQIKGFCLLPFDAETKEKVLCEGRESVY